MSIKDTVEKFRQDAYLIKVRTLFQQKEFNTDYLLMTNDAEFAKQIAVIGTASNPEHFEWDSKHSGRDMVTGEYIAMKSSQIVSKADLGVLSQYMPLLTQDQIQQDMANYIKHLPTTENDDQKCKP